jgi:hypothetical protein
MKTIFRIEMAVVSLFLMISGSQVNAVQARLNQIELMKQFTGSWKAEIAKDTVVLWDIKSTGTGLDCSYRYMKGGNVLFEGKQQWEYDVKTDKSVGTQVVNGKNEPMGFAWFTSKNKYVMVSYTNNNKSDNSGWKIEAEFKNPDTFIQNTFVNGKPINTVTFKRIK